MDLRQTGSLDSDERGEVLLEIARRTIERVLGVVAETDHEAFDEPWLEEEGATFVTLRRASGELRGCIGTLTAYRPLREDVGRNATSAAFNDPRFPPLTADELGEIRVDVSLLSPVEEMSVESEEDLLAQLRPGVDGVVIESGLHRGTFLPQVWIQLPEPRDFLRALKRKAGLAPNEWPLEVRVSRYTVEEWEESRA